MKLNLGCGNDYREGYVNCDISKYVKPDKIVDLEKKLPFRDSSVDEIIAYHVLEHINNFMFLMEEIYRVCKNKALVKVKVPYFAYPGAFQDPTHKRFFTLKTFDYFEPNNNLKYYSKARFKILKKELRFFTTRPSYLIDKFINKVPNFYERFLSGIIPAEELNVVLEVVKNGRI